VRRFLGSAIVVLPALLAVAIVVSNVWLFYAPLSGKSVLLLLVAMLYLAGCIFLRHSERSLARLAVLAWATAVVALVYGPVRLILAGEWKPDPVWASAYDSVPWWNDFVEEHRDSNRLWWQSYVYWRRPPYEGSFIKVDSRGVRRSWNAERHGDRPQKIFFFGGSTMWGSGARDEYTIPSYVARTLTEKGFDVDVTNFGETGWVNTQGVIMLMLELRKGNIPDVVVFYDGANDVHAAFQNREAGLPGNEINRRKQFYGSRAVVNTDRPKVDDDTLAKDTIDVYLANLDLLQALADRYGFSVVAVWQPISYVDKPLTPEEHEMAYDLGEPMAKFYQLSYGMMKQRAPRNVVNLSDAFATVKERVYLDHAHLNERGNEIVAQGVTRAVEDVLKAREKQLPAGRHTASAALR